ncbi:MAG: alginate lyase family protein [Breznakibacter sp.]
MRLKIFLVAEMIWLVSGLSAQSIWNGKHLAAVRQSLDNPLYADAYAGLIARADDALGAVPLSVMIKERVPASGDKHDYLSQARYYWPDPSKPDGKPYISRDGESNPELEKLDRNRLGDMASRVTTLSLAWYFSGDEKYARKAAELVRVWFFNPGTKMNPNLNYAQIIPGTNNDRGRCYGVIDAYSFVEMLDAVQLLEQSKAFTAKDARKLKVWFCQLLDWILTSEQGQEESRQKNNHAVAHDAQVIAYAVYTGRTGVAERFIRDFPARRIFTQIEPDGSQPQELRRTLAFGYSQFNLHHMVNIFLMAKKLDIRIDDSVSADGRNFYKAVDFLTPYVGKSVSDWPYRQISEWDYKQREFIKDLYRIYVFNPSRTDYFALFNNTNLIGRDELFNLLYLKTDR